MGLVSYRKAGYSRSLLFLLQDRVEASPEQLAQASALADRLTEESKQVTRVIGWYASILSVLNLSLRSDSKHVPSCAKATSSVPFYRISLLVGIIATRTSQCCHLTLTSGLRRCIRTWTRGL